MPGGNGDVKVWSTNATHIWFMQSLDWSNESSEQQDGGAKCGKLKNRELLEWLGLSWVLRFTVCHNMSVFMASYCLRSANILLVCKSSSPPQFR